MVILTVICCVIVSFLTSPGISFASDPESFGFSTNEIVWLKEHPIVRLAPDPDFPPIELIDSAGRYYGIAAGYIKLF